MDKRNLRMRELLQKAETALERTKPLDRKQVRELMDEAKSSTRRQGCRQGRRSSASPRAREALDERLRKQKKHAEQRLALLPAKARRAYESPRQR